MLGEAPSSVLTGTQSQTLEMQCSTLPEDLTIEQQQCSIIERQKTQNRKNAPQNKSQLKNKYISPKQIGKKYANTNQARFLKQKEQNQCGWERPARHKRVQVQKTCTEHKIAKR